MSTSTPWTPTCRAGIVAVVGIFGLAWLGDSFIAAHTDVIVPHVIQAAFGASLRDAARHPP